MAEYTSTSGVKAVPSREFMLRQAVLNAVWTDYSRALNSASGNVARVLWLMRADTAAIPGNLIVAITREFHKLQDRYEVAA